MSSRHSYLDLVEQKLAENASGKGLLPARLLNEKNRELTVDIWRSSFYTGRGKSNCEKSL